MVKTKGFGKKNFPDPFVLTVCEAILVKGLPGGKPFDQRP